jgi:hypothetical protein
MCKICSLIVFLPLDLLADRFSLKEDLCICSAKTSQAECGRNELQKPDYMIFQFGGIDAIMFCI